MHNVCCKSSTIDDNLFPHYTLSMVVDQTVDRTIDRGSEVLNPPPAPLHLPGACSLMLPPRAMAMPQMNATHGC